MSQPGNAHYVSRTPGTTVEFSDCHAVYETDKAVKIYVGDLNDERWFPKSAISDYSEVWGYKDKAARGPGNLVVEYWYAKGHM